MKRLTYQYSADGLRREPTPLASRRPAAVAPRFSREPAAPFRARTRALCVEEPANNIPGTHKFKKLKYVSRM